MPFMVGKFGKREFFLLFSELLLVSFYYSFIATDIALPLLLFYYG